MPTRLKSDASVLHARLALIVATEIRLIRNRQIKRGKKGESLDLEDLRKLKTLSDVLDDMIRTRRQLEDDMKQALERMAPDKLDKLAGGAGPTPQAPPATPETTQPKRRRARKGDPK